MVKHETLLKRVRAAHRLWVENEDPAKTNMFYEAWMRAMRRFEEATNG